MCPGTCSGIPATPSVSRRSFQHDDGLCAVSVNINAIRSTMGCGNYLQIQQQTRPAHLFLRLLYATSSQVGCRKAFDRKNVKFYGRPGWNQVRLSGQFQPTNRTTLWQSVSLCLAWFAISCFTSRSFDGRSYARYQLLRTIFQGWFAWLNLILPNSRYRRVVGWSSLSTIVVFDCISRFA